MSTKLQALRTVHKSLGEIYALFHDSTAGRGAPSSSFRDLNRVALLSNLANLKEGRDGIVRLIDSARRRKKIDFWTVDKLNRIRVRETRVRKHLERWARQSCHDERPGPEVSELTDFLSMLDRDLAPLKPLLKRATIRLDAIISEEDASPSPTTIGGNLKVEAPPSTRIDDPVNAPPAPGREWDETALDPAWAGDPIGWALEQMSRTRQGTPLEVIPGPPRPPGPYFETGEISAPFDLPRLGPKTRVMPVFRGPRLAQPHDIDEGA